MEKASNKLQGKVVNPSVWTIGQKPLSPVERYWQSEWRLYDENNLACFRQ